MEKKMEKFKVFVLDKVDPRKGYTVRTLLREESYKEILDITKRTGISITQFCSKAVDYALKNLEYVEY